MAPKPSARPRCGKACFSFTCAPEVVEDTIPSRRRCCRAAQSRVRPPAKSSETKCGGTAALQSVANSHHLREPCTEVFGGQGRNRPWAILRCARNLGGQGRN